MVYEFQFPLLSPKKSLIRSFSHVTVMGIGTTLDTIAIIMGADTSTVVMVTPISMVATSMHGLGGTIPSIIIRGEPTPTEHTNGGA